MDRVVGVAAGKLTNTEDNLFVKLHIKTWLELHRKIKLYINPM